MTNSEVKKKMLTKGRVEEICRASGASDEEVRSVLTSALPLLLGASGSSSNANSGLGMLTGLLGASGTNQADAEEQVSQQTGVGKNKVSLIMLAAIPLLLKMLMDDNSSTSTGNGKKKKKKPASGNSSAQSSGSISDLLLSLLK